MPLVRNEEAYYLSESEYLDINIRAQKRQELIDYEYVLDFGWDDIMEIGVNLKNAVSIINSFYFGWGKSIKDIASKIKLV